MAVRLAELLGGLSLAGDIGNGFVEGKVLRTALLAAELARRAAPAAAQSAYYVVLIRFFGCTAFAHEEAHLYGAGNDVAVRTTMALADTSNPIGTLSRMLTHIGPEASLLSRMQAIGRLVGDSQAFLKHARAQQDASLHLVRMFGLGDDVGGALATFCERWDGTGAPARIGSEQIPVAARLLQVADVFDLVLSERGVKAAARELRRRAGRHLDPALANLAAAQAEELAAVASAPDLWERFLAAEPQPQVIATEERVDQVAAALGRMVDVKSIFMLGHSQGVARRAGAIGTAMGLPLPELTAMRRAAWLHDIGRIGIPNAIWDKPARLSQLEREQVELHPLATERILRRSPYLAPLSPLASAACERLDGSGYHRRLAGTALDRAARIMAVADVAQALSEARPHRPAYSAREAARLLRAEADAGRLDAEAVTACLEGSVAPRPQALPRGISERECEVLRWVARGKTNPEIAQLLGISAKTVQHHVAHLYDKLGVGSRAGAALFAMEHDLLRE